MGIGYGFVCQKCNYEYNVCVGYGMFFSYTYKHIINEIKSGSYGDDWKDIFSKQDNIVVNIEKYFYTCPCGNWSVEPSLSLYVPKDFYKPTEKYVMEYD